LEFSQEQEQALERIRDWRDNSDEQVLYLAGYAGSGKTTLAKHVGADVFAAFTGKAAYVLQQKGCRNATTIHRLIYIPRMKSQQLLKQLLAQLEKTPDDEALRKRIASERENQRKPSWLLNLDSPLNRARLLVIDECSMVDERIGRDLLSFNCKVLVLGDPAQLPPVFGAGYFTSRTPDIMLTEVHRQARDNPILDLATIVRQERRLPLDHPCVINKPTAKLALGVDQLIVGRNATRRSTNARMRELLGYTEPLPVRGDRVVCLRNNHELELLNGATYNVTDTAFDYADQSTIGLELDGNLAVTAHANTFHGREIPHWAELDAEKFDYGYALTCHKSQGSQWDSVGIIDESHSFGPQRYNWLYTAITRAAKHLWVAA